MKTLKNYLAYCAVLALLLTGCSKEDSSVMDSPDNTSAKSVDITFGTVLNDLANRAMSRSHFDQIPDCSEAAPAYAELEISYAGQAPETMGPIQVAILSDEDGLFTDYSELLKVPVPNNSSVTVTLESFKVFDSGDNLIWIAPIESEEGEFDGYVDTPLPFDFEVSDGSKPYIDVEVLCFDRRMVNEYGYVFFDILPETIYPFCLFVNYCTEAGRHYVADYSVDLYFGTDANGIQLYNHSQETAMATTGDYGTGNYYADPLCLVVPGPPANLASDQPYLYLIIYPESWDGTGNIDETPVPVAVSWDMVEALLNDDGTTNEYLHLLIGECDGALAGDGSIPGGGTNTCAGDRDGDGCANNDDDDGDGVPDINDKCPDTAPGTVVNADGCPTQTGCESDFDGDTICDNEDPDIDNDGILNGADNCDFTVLGAIIDANGCSICDNPSYAYLNGVNGMVSVSPSSYALKLLNQTEVGNILISTTSSGDIEVLVGLLAQSSYDIIGYEINISQDGSDPFYSESMMINPALTTGTILFDVPDAFDETSFSAQIEVILCPATN